MGYHRRLLAIREQENEIINVDVELLQKIQKLQQDELKTKSTNKIEEVKESPVLKEEKTKTKEIVEEKKSAGRPKKK